MTKIFMPNLRGGLSQLASERIQRQLWLATEGPLIGSFEEAVCAAYDDSGLSDVLDTVTVEQELGPDVAPLLRELARAIARVDTSLPVSALIESAAMNRVRLLAYQAQQALDLTDRT